MKENKKQTANLALTLAYESVIELGWSHSKLCVEYGITLPTLRRIREGREGRIITDEYCLKCFLSIINEAFYADLKNNGGEQSSFFNRMFREILLAKFQIGEVKTS